MNGVPVAVHNAGGAHRVVSTKDLPGSRWLDILVAANCRVEVRARAAPTQLPAGWPLARALESSRARSRRSQLRTVSTQVCTHPDVILNIPTIKKLMGDRCDGVIGQARPGACTCMHAAHARGIRGRHLTPLPRSLTRAQLTEDWGDELFGALRAAGGRAYSNYAVGYNNVSVPVRGTLRATRAAARGGRK